MEHRQHRGPAAPTWCVLMEWRSATVQSTSGSGEPEPLQVMTAFSPSRTVRFTWLTLISGRSRRARHQGTQVWSSFCYSQPQGHAHGPRSNQAVSQISLQQPGISTQEATAWPCPTKGRSGLGDKGKRGHWRCTS